METEISIKTEPENGSIDLEVNEINENEEAETHDEECEKRQDAVIKEPRINIQSLYCYSCNEHFESLSLFKSHHHGDEEEEDEENENCLDKMDLDGMSVTCHKCDSHFLSLRLFLDHLYRETNRKKKKLLDNSNLNSDWQLSCTNKNNANQENLIKTFSTTKSQLTTKKKTKKTRDKNESGSKKVVACGVCGLKYGHKYVLYRHIRKFHVPDFVPYTSPELESTLIVNCEDVESRKASESKEDLEIEQLMCTNNNSNNNNQEPLIETDEEVTIENTNSNHNSNSSVSFSGSENNNNSDNEQENKKDPEFDPLDLDEDFNLNKETEDEDEISVQSYYEDDEEVDDDDDSDDEEFSPTKSKSRKKRKRPIKKSPKKVKKTIIQNESGSKKVVACGVCGLKYGHKYVLYRHIRKFHLPDFVPYTSPELEATLIVNCEEGVDVKKPTVKAKSESKVESEIGQNEMENSNEEESSPELESESDKKSLKVRRKEKLLDEKDNKEKRARNNDAPRLISCPICDKKYTYKYLLHRHIRKAHSQVTVDNRKREESDDEDEKERKKERRRKERKYIRVRCPEPGCGKVLSCAQALKYHRVVHLKQQAKPIETEVSCQYCGKVFPLKCYLRQHIRQLHEIYKPVLCDQCPMSFPNQANLKGHMRSHTKEKPYLCTQCPLTFGYSSTLARHMKTHAERTYKCDFDGCDKAFRMKQTLNRHQQKHTGARPYKCKFPGCTASFMDNKPLKTHYAQTHPDFAYARTQHENKAEPIPIPVSVPNPPQYQQQPQPPPHPFPMPIIPNPVPVWTVPRD